MPYASPNRGAGLRRVGVTIFLGSRRQTTANNKLYAGAECNEENDARTADWTGGGDRR